MKRFISLCAVTLAITVFLGGCKKYDDGPSISFKKPFTRVVNKWKVEYAIIDGEDKTYQYDSTTYEFLEDGFISFVTIENGDSAEQEGLWDLIEDDTQIRVLYTDPAVFPDRAYWEIKRLKEKEMWVKDDQDSIVYEFRLIPAGE